MRFDDYVSGAKSCIELIAVYAANKEQKFETKSYLRSFDRFIKYLQNFDDLNIDFNNNNDHEHQVRPRVIDAVNPYNNLAKNWDQKSIKLIKSYAKESNRRLQFLADHRAVHLDQLFEPQPVYNEDMTEIFRTLPSGIIGTKTFSLQRDIKIRNERFHEDYKHVIALERLKKIMQSAICVSKASDYNENKTKDVIQNTISRQTGDTETILWYSNDQKHEDFDVTITIPFSNQKALCISYQLPM